LKTLKKSKQGEIKVGEEYKVNGYWHVVSAIYPDTVITFRIHDHDRTICNRPLIKTFEGAKGTPKRISRKDENYPYTPFCIGDRIFYYDVDSDGEYIGSAVVKSGIFVDGNLKYFEIIDDKNPLQNIRINPKLVWSYAL